MTIPPSGWRACYKGIYWWDGEYDGHCILRSDHPENIHWDGMTWFGDNDTETYVIDIWERYDDDVLDYIKLVYGPPKGLLVL